MRMLAVYRPCLPRRWHLLVAAECAVVTAPDGKARLLADAAARVHAVPLDKQPRC